MIPNAKETIETLSHFFSPYDYLRPLAPLCIAFSQPPRNTPQGRIQTKILLERWHCDDQLSRHYDSGTVKVRHPIIVKAMLEDISMPLRWNDRHLGLDASLANLIRELPVCNQLHSNPPTYSFAIGGPEGAMAILEMS
jgi:hypothetical protein